MRRLDMDAACADGVDARHGACRVVPLRYGQARRLAWQHPLVATLRRRAAQVATVVAALSLGASGAPAVAAGLAAAPAWPLVAATARHGAPGASVAALAYGVFGVLLVVLASRWLQPATALAAERAWPVTARARRDADLASAAWWLLPWHLWLGAGALALAAALARQPTGSAPSSGVGVGANVPGAAAPGLLLVAAAWCAAAAIGIVGGACWQGRRRRGVVRSAHDASRRAWTTPRRDDAWRGARSTCGQLANRHVAPNPVWGVGAHDARVPDVAATSATLTSMVPRPTVLHWRRALTTLVLRGDARGARVLRALVAGGTALGVLHALTWRAHAAAVGAWHAALVAALSLGVTWLLAARAAEAFDPLAEAARAWPLRRIELQRAWAAVVMAPVSATAAVWLATALASMASAATPPAPPRPALLACASLLLLGAAAWHARAALAEAVAPADARRGAVPRRTLQRLIVAALLLALVTEAWTPA